MWFLRLSEQRPRHRASGQTHRRTGGTSIFFFFFYIYAPLLLLTIVTHSTLETEKVIVVLQCAVWKISRDCRMHEEKGRKEGGGEKQKQVLVFTDGCPSSWLSGWVCHRPIWINIPRLSCTTPTVQHHKSQTCNKFNLKNAKSVYCTTLRRWLSYIHNLKLFKKKLKKKANKQNGITE